MGYIGPKEPPVITPGSISNSDLAAISQYRLKGRVSSGSGNPEDLTADQTITLINQATVNAIDATRLSSYYRSIRIDGAGNLTQRPRINFISGSGITLSGADDSTDAESDLTVALAQIANKRVLGNVSGSSAAPSALGSDDLFTVLNDTGTAQLANNRLAALVPSPAGTYRLAEITVDAQGRITAASAGGALVNTDISASAEIAVSKLADGAAYQIIQTAGDGTTVEWSDSITLPGNASAKAFIPSSSDVPSNGLYLSAANTVAVATNSTGRLFIDSSGNVGVGAAPATLFDVTSSSEFTLGLQAKTSSTQTALANLPNAVFTNTSTAAGNGVGIRLRLADTGGTLRVAGQIGAIATGKTASAVTADLYFAPNATERMRLTSAGLLGVGTSIPANAIDTNGAVGVVYGGATGGIRLFGNTGTVNNAILQHTFTGGNDQLELAPAGSSATSAIAFLTATGSTLGTRMFIGPTGLVGIGTSVPGTDLHVNVGSGNCEIRQSVNNVTTAQFISSATDQYIVNGGSGAQTFWNGGSERFRCDASGRLLVGTSSDSGGALLQVNGDRIRVGTAKTPASATDTGTAGEICWDANYVYVCTATNTWKRSALSTW